MSSPRQPGKVFVADAKNKALKEKAWPEPKSYTGHPDNGQMIRQYLDNLKEVENHNKNLPQYPATWLTEDMDGREFVEGVDFEVKYCPCRTSAMLCFVSCGKEVEAVQIKAASPLPASSSIEGQKEESQSAEEFAEGMMGLGKFDPKTWHHADAMLYNTIVKSVRYGAGEYSKLKECHDGLKADLERCKLVASSEIIKLRQSLNDISLYNNGFVEYFRQHNYRLMYDLWKRVYGIATAYSTPPTISKEDEQ